MRSCEKKSVVFSLLVFMLVYTAVLFVPGICIQAAEKTISAIISKDRVVVGKQLHIAVKQEDVHYVSSDTTIATVSPKGVITAKKAGKVVITVKKSGYSSKKFPITVKAYGKYPSIPVTLDEVVINLHCSNDKIEAEIINHAGKGSIKEIEYQYDACVYPEVTEEGSAAETGNEGETPDPKTENGSDSEPEAAISGAIDTEAISSEQTPEEKPEISPVHQQITVKAKNIAAGTQEKIVVTGDFGNPDKLEMKLVKIRLTTGKSVFTYDVAKDRTGIKWTIKDTTPPKITGWVGKNSYNSKDVYMVAFSDKKYDFRKYVSVSDNMGGNVKLTVDTSKINWKKKGVYEITYRAEDLAGNVTKKTAKVQVRPAGDLEHMADTILKQIVKDSWSDKQKAEAIYRYMRKNYSYVDSNDHASWEKSAVYGLRYHSGNCFVYYSVSRLLLTRCGIPNIEVKRSAGSRHGHWWNYVYVNGGWYHFDTTPRRQKATFCLVTDDQLSAYSKAAGNSHIWDKSLIPAGAKKKISSVKWGKQY